MEFKLKTRVVMNSSDTTTRQPGPHLTPDQIRQFESRELALDEIAAVHRHLGGCAQCRRILRSSLGQIPIPPEALAMPEPLHLSYEELVAYMDRKAGPEVRDRAEAHLFLCSACSRELAGLEQLEKQLSLPAIAESAAPTASKAATSGPRLRTHVAKLFAVPGLGRQLAYGLAAIVAGIFVLLQAGIGGVPVASAPGAARVFAPGAQSPGLGLGGIVLVGAGLAYLLYVLFKKR